MSQRSRFSAWMQMLKEKAAVAGDDERSEPGRGAVSNGSPRGWGPAAEGEELRWRKAGRKGIRPRLLARAKSERRE